MALTTEQIDAQIQELIALLTSGKVGDEMVADVMDGLGNRTTYRGPKQIAEAIDFLMKIRKEIGQQNEADSFTRSAFPIRRRRAIV